MKRGWSKEKFESYVTFFNGLSTVALISNPPSSAPNLVGVSLNYNYAYG